MSSFGRELQCKFAKFSGLGPHGNPPVIILHDAVTDAQPQAHALAYVLGREERVENLVEVLALDARTVVADGQATRALVHAAFDPDCGRGTVELLLGLKRIERVLN